MTSKGIIIAHGYFCSLQNCKYCINHVVGRSSFFKTDITDILPRLLSTYASQNFVHEIKNCIGQWALYWLHTVLCHITAVQLTDQEQFHLNNLSIQFVHVSVEKVIFIIGPLMNHVSAVQVICIFFFH